MQRISLIPQPSRLTPADGELDLASLGAIVAADPETTGPAWLLSDLLASGTGLRLAVADAFEGPALRLRLEGRRPEADTTAAEAYRLEVAPGGVDLVAAHPAGISRGIATLRQLLPPGSLRAAPGAGAVLPLVSIEDEPRLRWRGVMIDVARHFQAKDFVLRMIDRAWLHRLNTVHLHLTDDQGWRVEIPSRPRLAEVAAWRAETVVGHAREDAVYDGTPHGGYYTLDDLREIVAYARARHINVVPEINLPGHTRSVLAAYPELGAGQNRPVATTFGVFEEVLEPTEESLAFAREVLDTVAEVFDSPFIHIGGDEVPTTQWESSPTAAALMEREGIAEVRGVQAWFTRALTEHVASLGRRAIGWDEVLDGGAPGETVISVWRNEAYIKKAAEAGHEVIAIPEPYVYFDHYESTDPGEPLRIHGLITAEKVAGWDPVPPGVEESAVLGAQCQLWSEYLPRPADVEYAAFPRLAVFADVAWAAPEARRASPVMDRLVPHLERLDALGVAYRPLEGPRPWQAGGTGARKRSDVEFTEHPAE
ncbi:beta-N-acetylhexosaminidase [Glycomyces salinus]|uniref:beta-N-acetylhexosaminidase n=1 Tax=Glycomyces salinus TaxID=980294 RepID=UPI0018ED1D86|nr:beta-N-acetylhexosaminidase [Glycomyces salinus]